MGDHDNGFALGKLLKRGLHLKFIVRVGEGRGLIQYNDRRVFQHNAGNGNSLLFAAGKVNAFRPDHGVYTVWHF
ncbi:hypothetical protein SDC9_206027 [bioreactor metagenome]|uniref:Uncharacterized protein n=1 Tax=bioreactor metagenome TaxID=1076179 RepID=A0A645JFE7_9ZZZZ